MNRRETLQQLAIVGALLAAPACRNVIVLPGSPGSVQVEMKLQTPAQYANYEFTWAATYLDNPSMTASGSLSMVGGQLNGYNGYVVFPVSASLPVGKWQFGANALGDGQAVLATTCNQQIYEGVTSIITFTEGGSGCVCVFGCSPP